jgi:hypothetical protein
MLHAGEEVRFITRRLVICASEDIGLADSNALLVAQAAAQAVEFIGLPEANLLLAHATLYLATAPKSNSATVAIGNASAEVREGRTLAVPQHLRDGHYKGPGATRSRKGLPLQPRFRRGLRATEPTCPKEDASTHPPRTAWKSESRNASTTGEHSLKHKKRAALKSDALLFVNLLLS